MVARFHLSTIEAIMLIASRTLWIMTGQSRKRVDIRIMLPKKWQEHWSVAYEIDWPGARQASEAFGFDALQALNLALKMIGSELYASDYHQNGRLIWLEAGAGYGFPVANAIKDMLIGDDVLL
jgi:hypothetical protein